MVSQRTTSTTIANLEAAVQSCSSLEIQFEATSKEKPVNIKIILWGAQWARNGHNRPGWVYVIDIGGVSHQLLDHRDVLNCQEALCAVEEFVDSPIELKTLSLKTTGSSVTRSTLKSLVESALCETLKMEIQTHKEKEAALKVSKAKENAQIANFVGLLKSGPDGVVQWSNTNRRALAVAGQFTKLDLSKLNLQGWKPSGDNTRFCSVNMRNAKLVGQTHFRVANRIGSIWRRSASKNYGMDSQNFWQATHFEQRVDDGYISEFQASRGRGVGLETD